MNNINELITRGWILRMKLSEDEYFKDRPYVAQIHNPDPPMNETCGHCTRGTSCSDALFKLEAFIDGQRPNGGDSE